MSTPTITRTEQTVDEQLVDLYTEDVYQLGAANGARFGALLAAAVDTHLLGADHCDPDDRASMMTSKIRQAAELIESLPCLCDPTTSDDLDHRDDRCPRCRALGQHTPQGTSTPATTSLWLDTITQTLLQLGLADDVDTAATAAATVTTALWSRRQLGTLLGALDPAEGDLREENRLLRQQLTAITQRYHENDPELCEACDTMANRGPCPYHNGHNSGALYMAEAVAAVCDDLDTADRVHQWVADRDA